MITQHNRKSLRLGVPGPGLQTVAPIVDALLTRSALSHPEWIHLLLSAAWLVGTALIVVGLVFYAKAKGRSPWLGLLGCLGLPGAIVLAVLRDRTRVPPQSGTPEHLLQ